MSEIITFYKLQSPYEGDITKNCKLTLTEMDSNFLAFKDNDISGATFDKESNTLYISKNNGELIGVDLSPLHDEIPAPIEYHAPDLELSGLFENDILTLTVGYSGESASTQTIQISGFTSSISPELKISGLTEVIHDNTLQGKGTEESPLTLNPVYDISCYEPCLGIVDELPENPNIGDRYITSGTTSELGCLYNKKALPIITSLLQEENNRWRIPTKDDWDILLNFTEDHPEEKNHDTEENGVYGAMAAYKLKSTRYWSDSNDAYGFSILPTVLSDKTYSATFWTDTNSKAKAFKDNVHTVEQVTGTDVKYYSIRLIADCVTSPMILGRKYPILLFKDIKQCWTKVNLNYNLNDSSLVQKPSLLANESVAYYVNEWNGEFWNKIEIIPGSKIIIAINNTYKEYLIKDNEIILQTTFEDKNGMTIVKYDAGWY